MKAVFSFWTKPMVDGKLHKSISSGHYARYWFLSVALAARNFDEVELVTDKKGYQLLAPYNLPFTNVNISLDKLDYHTDLWAIGKIYAYAQQTTPFLHIDYDVFFFGKVSEELKQAPIVIQHTESFKTHDFYPVLAGKVLESFPELNEILTGTPYAYNCGIFGGRDIATIKEYTEEALLVAETYMSVREKLEPFEQVWFSCIFEQYVLATLLNRKGIKPFAMNQSRTKEYGYTHVWGGKWDQVNIDKVTSKIQKLFPNNYERLMHTVAMQNPLNRAAMLGG